TLAICPDTADLARLLAAARECATQWRTQPISLVSLGLFAATPATLFLSPVVTWEMLARHRSLLGSLSGQDLDPFYQADRWVPHVTLAGDLNSAAAAIAALEPLTFPIAAVLAELQVVRFRPIR